VFDVLRKTNTNSAIIPRIKQPPRHPTIDELDLVSVLSTLGHPIRMHIVNALAQGGELGWGELDVPVANSTLSHHLKLLRDSGITRTRAEGARCFVSLRREDLDHRFPGLLDAVLHAPSRAMSRGI
jgi:DNA-binding transcriptional ArsR family regulator